MEKTKLTLDDVKDYIDRIYGEFTGEGKADVIQCNYAEGKKDKLLFYMFNPALDYMEYVGSVNSEWDITIDSFYDMNLINVTYGSLYDLNDIKTVVNLIFIILSNLYETIENKYSYLSTEIERIAKPKVEEGVDVNG